MAEREMARRSFCRSAGVSALLASAAPTLLAGCSTIDAEEKSSGGSTLDRAKQRGFIEVGFANESPYAYTDKRGRFVGAMAELAKVIFGELGVREVRGVRLDFAELIAGLIAGRYDTIAAGMFVTPERCALVTFADPDYCAETAFLVAASNPHGLSTFEDIARQPNLRLGVLTGAVEGDHAVAAGVKKSQIRMFADQPNAFEALETERIDAITLTRVSLADLRSRHKGAPYEVTEPFPPGGCGAFAFRNQDTALVQAWNDKLTELKRSSRLLPIIKPFGFTEDELPGDHTQTELCSPPTPSSAPTVG